MKNSSHHKYFAYARKSTDDKDRQIRSIPDQLAEMREKTAPDEVEISDILSESQTAKVPGRPVFNNMLERIEKGEAQGIVAWHPDRLARNMVDGTRILDMLTRGVLKDLRFVTFPFENTSAGRYMLAMMFCQSTYYCDNLSDNVKRGFRQKLKNGVWPEKAPIGYRNDQATKSIVIDTTRAKFIQKAFEMYATGKYTLAQVREQVTRMGLMSRKGGTLSLSNIQYILKNSFYHGLMRFKGEFHDGKHEPLITKSLFDRVQAAMTAKSQPRRTSKLKDYLYRGMFFCGECGCMITTETQKGHNYLRCTKRKGRCSQPFVREESIAEQITEALPQFGLPTEITDWMIRALQIEQGQHTDATDYELKRLRDEVKRRSDQIGQLIRAFAQGDLSHDEFVQVKNQVLIEKRDLEEKAVTLERHRSSWFEPAIRFVQVSKQAVFLAKKGEQIQIRDFFRKVGSNPILTNRLLQFEGRGPWQLVVNARRLAQHDIAASNADAAMVGEPDQHVLKLGD